MNRVASILSMICLGSATLALPTQAVMGAAPAQVPDESEDVRIILDALVGVDALMPSIKLRVKAEADDLMRRDPKVDHALKANPALKAALIDRATARYQSMVRDRLPAYRSVLGRLFNEGMSVAQRKATAKMLVSESGKRIFASVFTQMASLTAQQAETAELSESQINAIISKNDIPVMLAFSQTGADKKFDEIMDSLGEIDSDEFEPLFDDNDDFLVDILNEMQFGVNYSTFLGTASSWLHSA